MERADHLAVGVLDPRAEHGPVAEIGSGGELPVTVHGVATVDRHGGAARRVGRRDPGVGIVAPDLLLHPFVLQRELPRMHAHDARHPSRRRAPVADVDHRGEEIARVGLQATEVGRLQQPDQARVLELLRDVVGQPPEVVAGR